MRFLKKTAGREFILASFCPSILKLQGQESMSVPQHFDMARTCVETGFCNPPFCKWGGGGFNKSLKHIANLRDNFG